jgi:hypothetical protein
MTHDVRQNADGTKHANQGALAADFDQVDNP